VPPSTSGGTTVLEILGLLKRFPSSELKPSSLSAVHLISEAERLAYADRARWLGDPAFVSPPVAGILDANYLAARSAKIDPLKSMGFAEAGQPSMKSGMLRFAPQPRQASYGTSHLSAVDESGQVVSLTMSVQLGFGAQIMAGGFILNNELTDFSFVPAVGGRPVANAAQPGKRPLSSMSPTIVFDKDGKFFASLGSPGGRQIIAYVAQALVSLIDGQLSMQQAADVPRHVNTNGPTLIEERTSLETLRAELERMGHTVRVVPFDSGLNGIRRVSGGYEGGADPRRTGIALGD
jgi:gamma-glutamyltranspeptidase/glutathione hydrolase